jgi:hypothetical protein
VRAARKNGGEGIYILAASNNLIGGTAGAERNVISGNGGNAVALLSGADANMVRGNFLGTDVTGTQAVGNALDGVFVAASVGPASRRTTPCGRPQLRVTVNSCGDLLRARSRRLRAGETVV